MNDAYTSLMAHSRRWEARAKANHHALIKIAAHLRNGRLQAALTVAHVALESQDRVTSNEVNAKPDAAKSITNEKETK
jgi:uncharacterized protein (DUF1778 family)